MENAMENTLLAYLAGFFLVFLSCAILCFCLRLVVWIYLEYWQPQSQERARARAIVRERCRRYNDMQNGDRQGNIYTISDDTLSAGGNNYADFFYLEPSSEEAARIRAQLDKDDKELPSYDDVMALNNLATPTAAAAASTVVTIGTHGHLVHNDNELPAVPPYSEIDPHAIVAAGTSNATPIVSPATDVPRPITILEPTDVVTMSASTSRAAAAAMGTPPLYVGPADSSNV